MLPLPEPQLHFCPPVSGRAPEPGPTPTGVASSFLYSLTSTSFQDDRHYRTLVDGINLRLHFHRTKLFWKLAGFDKRLHEHRHPTFLHPRGPSLQATKSQQQDTFFTCFFIILC